MLYWGAISLSMLWCASQVAQDSIDFQHRLELIEVERGYGRLASAEAMLVDLQTEIEARHGPGFWVATVMRERGLLRRTKAVRTKRFHYTSGL
ncbi:MAG: hypothetical protein WDO73_00690 [Ignavibacteriota bacterium]